MRIKELEDVLKLVDDMPRDRQLPCVQYLAWQVEKWEERVCFEGSDLEYLAETIKRRKEQRDVGRRNEPPF